MISFLRLRPLALLAFYLVFCATFSRADSTSSDFVVVHEGKFQLGESSYTYVGVNCWQAVLLGMSNAPGDRARLVRELDRLAALGLTNVRVLALSEKSEASRLEVFSQLQPGVDSEAWFQGLDFVLDEMGKRRMKAILCLNNYWTWSGGFAQYVNWCHDPEAIVAEADWSRFNDYLTRFYVDEKAQALCRETVTRLVQRKNSLNGRLYRNDPTIMSWQLCNEPRPGAYEQTKEKRGPMIAWVARSAKHLRSLGVRQLISTGSEGVFGCNEDEDLYRALHAVPEIDYLTLHLWPQNWAWFDPKDPKGTFAPMMTRCEKYIRDHVRIAKSLGKPLVVEEFGLARDNGSFSGEAKTTYRDLLLRMVGDQWKESVVAHGPLQGINIWTWSGEGVPRDASGAVWSHGLPIIGDNPSEPQGVYSVLQGDTSTIESLREFAGFAKSVAVVK